VIESNLRCPRCSKRMVVRDQPDPGVVRHECLSCPYWEMAPLARPTVPRGTRTLMAQLRDEVRGG